MVERDRITIEIPNTIVDHPRYMIDESPAASNAWIKPGTIKTEPRPATNNMIG